VEPILDVRIVIDETTLMDMVISPNGTAHHVTILKAIEQFSAQKTTGVLSKFIKIIHFNARDNLLVELITFRMTMY
jgi:hypothetical protein